MGVEDLEQRIVDLLRGAGRPLGFDEIARGLEWSGDRRPLRRILAKLVREGIVERVPDYEGRRHVYSLGGGAHG